MKPEFVAARFLVAAMPVHAVVAVCLLLPAAAPAMAQDLSPDVDRTATVFANAGNVLELHTLMQQSALLELRSTFNGTYGASLLLDQSTLTYYTASFHHKTLLRVYKNRSEKNAEHHYRELSDWSEASARNEILAMKNPGRRRAPTRADTPTSGAEDRSGN